MCDLCRRTVGDEAIGPLFVARTRPATNDRATSRPDQPPQRRPAAAAVALALAGAALGVGPAGAEEAGGAAVVLPGVSVTAKGYEAEVLETPHALEVVEEGEIARSSASNVGELLTGRPGLAVQGDGAWGLNPVIRGLNKEHIVVMVDGVRINSAQPQGAIASFVDLGLLERVEVVKGPVSVLYGTGAMGGVVNLITRRPRFTPEASFSGTGRLAYQSVSEGKEGHASLAYGSPDHALQLGVSLREHEDYDTPAGKVERSGYREASASGQYQYQLAPGHALRLNLQHHVADDVWYPGSAKPHPHPLVQQVTVRSPTQRRTLYELGYEGELDTAGSPRFSASIYRQEVYREIRAFGDFVDPTVSRDIVWNEVTFGTTGGTLQLGLAPAADHWLLAGAEAWRMTGDPDRFQLTPQSGFTQEMPSSPFRNGRIEALGVFLQDEWEAGPWLTTLGVRYDRVEGDADSMGFGPATRTTGLDKTSSAVTGSLGTVYRMSSAFHPYVNLARAFRAPDMRERFEDSTRGDGFYVLGNPQLDPETSITIELGAKGLLATGTRYTVAAYRTEIRDYIAGRITGQIHPGTGLPIKLTENLAKVVITGLEAELEHRLSGHYYAWAGLTLLRGENRFEDEPLHQMPPHEGSLGLRYLPPTGWTWDARLRAVARQDRVAEQFSNGTERPTPGFVTADLGAGYRFGRADAPGSHELRLSVTNVFDRAYREHLMEGDILMPGRSFNVSWSGRF